MRRGDLRALLPIQIVDGGCLLADGSAVGLVSGGAVTWELLAHPERQQVYAQYHALLMAQEQPLSVTWIDQALDLQRAMLDLNGRHQAATSALQATILSEIVDQIAAAAEVGATSRKQIVWQVPIAGQAVGATAVRRWWPGGQAAAGAPPLVSESLGRAVRAALRLAEQLRQLDGQPAPQPMRATEIAQCWWLLLDPIRARRVPLGVNLLRLVQPVIDGAPV